MNLTLFQYTGYQFGTALPFSLYLRHGFRSDSENVYGNRVNQINEISMINEITQIYEFTQINEFTQVHH